MTARSSGAIQNQYSNSIDTDRTGKFEKMMSDQGLLQIKLNSFSPFQSHGRPEDRKTSLHFEFKNFIHRYEPSEWGYGK
jgi:hypothetical protein